eukprot:scaffold8535_cov132-Cylindrotheca_fusiformis.AAC.17
MVSSSTPEEEEKKKSEDKGTDEETGNGTTAADESGEGGDDPMTPSNKRRFFPRVKHLLTREWESFLAGVLDAMDAANAPAAAAASHKATNPWYKAFDLVYGGVAADCSVPTGKNRFHKFKDKIVELWTAMETEAPDDHPLKPRAMQQLTQYRLACEEASKAESASPKAPGAKSPGVKKPPSAAVSAAKRSYNSTFHPTTGRTWKHLNEGSALEKLPEPLKSLTHLRHMGTEIGASTVKASVEVQYMAALEAYLTAAPPAGDSNAAYDKSQILVALYRLSQSPKEAKDVLAAYERTVQEYMVSIDPTSTSV